MINTYEYSESDSRPYFSIWDEHLKKVTGLRILKKDTFYTAEQLMSLPQLSSTKVARIKRARPNTVVWLSKIGKHTELGVRHIPEEELNYKNKIDALQESIRLVKEEIDKHIPKELKDRLAELERELKKVKL